MSSAGSHMKEPWGCGEGYVRGLGQPGLLLLPLLDFKRQTSQDSMEAEILLCLSQRLYPCPML